MERGRGGGGGGGKEGERERAGRQAGRQNTTQWRDSDSSAIHRSK